MSQVQNVWHQLIQRRLWPVAVLLLAALVAVPLILANQPEPAAAPAVAPLSGEDALATQPIVALADADDRSKRRHVLGTAKNPFAVPTPVPSAIATDTAPTTAVDPTPETLAPDASQAPSGGSAPNGGSTGPTAPSTPAQPTDPAPTYALNELTVRFGDAASGELERRTLERLQPLPSRELPALIYLGVLADGKTAVFLLDHDIEAIGDGICRPNPVDCQTLRLRVGDTEFLDVSDETGAVTAQYQLELIKIHRVTTASASQANASSKSGRRLLKARVATDGPTGYRWDPAAGELERRPGMALRGTLADASLSLP